MAVTGILSGPIHFVPTSLSLMEWMQNTMRCGREVAQITIGSISTGIGCYWFIPKARGKCRGIMSGTRTLVTDFHEMGTNSTHFFEPMKPNGSMDPIMPAENYTTLNDTFATYYQRELDALGSLYFTKEVFDGTYPGYGSSYPDLQGGLGILFEQASSRGHLQETEMGDMSFAYTIRHQFVNSIATVEAAVDHRAMLHRYQWDFFDSALANAANDPVKSYVFGDEYDHNRLKAFVQMLQQHRIKVFALDEEVTIDGKTFKPGSAYVAPTAQSQYRMVQTMFETYSEYRDSVFYDASAWSLANAYNMKYAGTSRDLSGDIEITPESHVETRRNVPESSIAYLVSWDDYYAPAMLYHLQSNGARTMIAQNMFELTTTVGNQEFSFGTIVVPVQKQDISSDSLYRLMQDGANRWHLEVSSAMTGLSSSGVDLGSRWISPVEKPTVLMPVGNGVRSYEAGYVWHLLDQRVKMPVIKVQTHMFNRVDLGKYSTLVLVSGSYANFDSTSIQNIKDWLKDGNTLITIGTGTKWAIDKKLVKAKLIDAKENKADSTVQERYNYAEQLEIRGRNEVGGAIFAVDLDVTHPVGYGYRDNEIPVYRNNNVWIEPTENEFSNVALYTDDPHIDGFITRQNLEDKLKGSASIMVVKAGSGRAVLFADDPNFRGTWYGTNKLFLNSVFFGNLIRVP